MENSEIRKKEPAWTKAELSRARLSQLRNRGELELHDLGPRYTDKPRLEHTLTFDLSAKHK